jgi:hypothetical protein
MTTPVERAPVGGRGRPPGYFDLRHALEGPGCAVCAGAARSAWRYIDMVLWEGVTDPGIRTRLRASRGFCREHAMLALRVAARLHVETGIAVIFEDLLAQTEVATAAIRPLRRRGRSSRTRARPTAPCPACVTASDTVELFLQLLGSADPDSELGVAAREGDAPLCATHLLRGLESAPSDVEADRLREVFTIGAERLRRDLREYLRKRDYRFSSETVSSDEATAWARAVYAMVGDPLRAPPDR